jgi:hypothetical protein
MESNMCRSMVENRKNVRVKIGSEKREEFVNAAI